MFTNKFPRNFQLAKLENARSKINNLICHIHKSSQSSCVIKVDSKDESQSLYNLGDSGARGPRRNGLNDFVTFCVVSSHD